MKINRGFTYIAVLVMVALTSLGLTKIGSAWSMDEKRMREQELLRVGEIYIQAIASYREASPGSLKKYPPSLEALLWDERHLGIRRHLRKLYTDPVRPGQPFALLKDEDGNILGVYSTSAEMPLRRFAWIPAGGRTVAAEARSYRDWHFTPQQTPP